MYSKVQRQSNGNGLQTKNLAKTHQLITRSTTCKLHELIQYTTAYLEQTGGETQALSEKKVL